MAYTYQYFRLDINELIRLPGKKYVFREGILKGQELHIDTDSITIGNELIRIYKQRTNYGEKNFFLCGECLAMRKHLYYINGQWKCRECGHLKYISTSTYRNGMDYCDLKIDKILDKLKVPHNIEYYTGDSISIKKPYKMRWSTYSKLMLNLKYWQNERADRWLRLVAEAYK